VFYHFEYTAGMKRSVVVDPNILAGKPVIAGTRMPVCLILNLLANGCSFERIVQAYPVLTTDDVRAAVRHAEARMRREETLALEGPA
jgi:uncharacterized protein (DUF433 family)